MVLLTSTGCWSVSSGSEAVVRTDRLSSDYSKPTIAGTINSPEITESSGLAASRCNPGVFWTHNDSGDEANIYALDGKGQKIGTWNVTGAKNRDWEDMATFKNERGECFLYIADSGNNTGARDIFTVYRVREPNVSAGSGQQLKTEPAEAINYKYPDVAQNAETLLVHPQTGDIYILTKSLGDPSAIYKLRAEVGKTNTLKKIADLKVPAVPNGFLTGGDISSDGRRVVICDYFSAYEISLPKKSKNFDEIWKEAPLIVDLGEREQGEAVCYTPDGNAIYATSEKKNSPFIEVRRK